MVSELLCKMWPGGAILGFSADNRTGRKSNQSSKKVIRKITAYEAIPFNSVPLRQSFTSFSTRFCFCGMSLKRKLRIAFQKFQCSQVSTLKEVFYPDKTILQYRGNEVIAYSRKKEISCLMPEKTSIPISANRLPPIT